MKEYYSLLAIPSANVSDLIAQLRVKLKLQIGREYTSINAPPHLTICSITMPSGRPEELCALLNNTFAEISLPVLHTGELKSFPLQKTVYLSVQNELDFTTSQKVITETLKNYYPSLKRNMKIPSVPHLSLGRGFSGKELDIIKSFNPGSGLKLQFSIIEFRLLLNLDGKMKQIYSYRM